MQKTYQGVYINRYLHICTHWATTSHLPLSFVLIQSAMCRWRLVPRKFLRPLLSFLVFKNLTIYYFIHFCLLIYICRLEYGIIILIPYNVRLLSVLVPFSWYCSTPSKIVILYGSNKRLGQRTFYHTFSLEELPPILFNKNKNIHYLLIT